MTPLDHLQPQLNRIQQRAFIIGAIALAVCAFGVTLNAEQFFHSYLFGYLFWFGITIGCFAVVMLHHLAGGGWGFIIQRLLESGTRTLPLMALLFLPLLGGMHELYLWARPEAVASDKILQHKSLYLNLPFFGIRAAVYFAIWGIFAYLLNKWSSQQDRTADPLLTQRLQKIAGPALVVYVLTMTFAAMDWVMSLDPHWYSTIYGVVFIIGQGLLTLAAMIIAARLLAKRAPLAEVVLPKHFHDLGNLMMAFVMLWAYVAFSQFLIIWTGNLPEEITWYKHRLHRGWGVLAVFIVVFHFAVPFVLLLSRKTKQRAEVLAKVAIAMVVMRLVDLFWIVAPNFHPEKFSVHWMDVSAPIGIGGIWVATFIWQLKGRALLPLHDPRLKEAFHHE